MVFGPRRWVVRRTRGHGEVYFSASAAVNVALTVLAAASFGDVRGAPEGGEAGCGEGAAGAQPRRLLAALPAGLARGVAGVPLGLGFGLGETLAFAAFAALGVESLRFQEQRRCR